MKLHFLSKVFFRIYLVIVKATNSDVLHTLRENRILDLHPSETTSTFDLVSHVISLSMDYVMNIKEGVQKGIE